MKPIDRRYLLGLGGLAALGALYPTKILLETTWEYVAHSITESDWVPPVKSGVTFGMVIDLGKCIGCRRCSYACKRENNVPDTISPPYITLFQTDRTGVGDFQAEESEHGNRLQYTRLYKHKRYMPVQCNHCQDAPCVKVCPTQASYKAPDGIVMVDYSKCIGCRYCMQACPYQARRYNWRKPVIAADRLNPLVPVRPHGVVEKCTFCVHRTRLGKTTRCVEACPNKVRTFGNLNDSNSAVSKLIRTERNFRLKEGLNTGPQIWYLTAHGEKPMRWFRALPPPTNIRGIDA